MTNLEHSLVYSKLDHRRAKNIVSKNWAHLRRVKFLLESRDLLPRTTLKKSFRFPYAWWKQASLLWKHSDGFEVQKSPYFMVLLGQLVGHPSRILAKYTHGHENRSKRPNVFAKIAQQSQSSTD